MAHPLVEQAVEARLRAHWGDLCPIYVENTLAAPPGDGSPYLMLQFPVAQDRRWSRNRKLHQQTGGARIVIHLPSGTGTAQMTNWGERLCAIFRGERFDGVICAEPQPPSAGEPDGAYYWASVVVPFTFFYSAQPPAQS